MEIFTREAREALGCLLSGCTDDIEMRGGICVSVGEGGEVLDQLNDEDLYYILLATHQRAVDDRNHDRAVAVQRVFSGPAA